MACRRLDMPFNDESRIWIDQVDDTEAFVWCCLNKTYKDEC